MYLDEICEYCITLPGVEETQPFGPDHIVYKVKGKMFLLVGIEETPIRFNVKCNPERAIQLREDFPHAVLPGWHMNKKHESVTDKDLYYCFVNLGSANQDIYVIPAKVVAKVRANRAIEDL